MLMHDSSTFISDHCSFFARLPNNLKNIPLFLYEVGRAVDSLSISKGTKKIFLVPSIVGKQNVNKEITIICVRQFTMRRRMLLQIVHDYEDDKC